jgi:outer membrane lipoprotein SlyB
MVSGFTKLTKIYGITGYASKTIEAYKKSALGISKGAIKYLKGGLSTSTWIMLGFLYTAETGLNYRRYKKGRIDKNEFWERIKKNSLATIGGIAGGAGGTAAGFAIGTMILPGLGSAVGAISGGILGGLAGEKVVSKSYKTLEKKIGDL